MYKIFLLSLLLFAKLLHANPDRVLHECNRFNAHCDRMMCMMVPVAADVLDLFQNKFEILEKELYSAFGGEGSVKREKILQELAELKQARSEVEQIAYKTNWYDFISWWNKPSIKSKIKILEKELISLKEILSNDPKYKRALDEILIVRERLQYLKAGLHPRGVVTVPGGSYKMGKEGAKVDVTLSPFLVAETVVTQGEWKALAQGKNPSKFKDNNLHPVEQVSWSSAVMYTLELNKKLGLESPLDISAMDQKKWTGKWEDGTLNFNGEESKIKYDLSKKGYRLPTSAEWEYLLRNLGKANGKNPHDLSEKDLGDYVVFWENSNGSTQEVRSKKPFMIDERKVYGIAGNVHTWTLDKDTEKPAGGNNPLQLSGNSNYRVVRGGGWYDSAENVRSAVRNRYEIGYPSGSVGFRVVRTL